MIEIAKKAALEAGGITLKRRFTTYSVERKGTADNIATEIDKESEKQILKVLKAKFPKHNFLSEEIGKEDNGSDYWWVIDPIDGTGSYFSGLPTYGISVGLLKDGKPILGVLNFPALNNLYWSVEGKGAFKNGKRIQVSNESELSKIMVGYDLGWMGERTEEVNKYLLPLVDKVRYTPILGCTVAGLSYVAEGIYGAYIHWAYPWDFVAGAAIIKEAGGEVTGIKGEKINWLADDMLVFASNGKVHNEILSMVR